ncbi:sir2 family domain-containing protein [Apiospora marii]|uniref:Sir2 family domain-containing protein n=1 Tax=Apiospora marii TaxID=335849 RepID=A0ABR1RDE4_9PEZI
MGNENSTLIDPDTPTQTLKDRSLRAVADHIRNGGGKRIVVLTGAGISTAAGSRAMLALGSPLTNHRVFTVPDFRSPKTGLYHNLARLNLPHAEAVFEIRAVPGKFHPTISHAFIGLLAKRKILRMLFTQNIDCLERRAGVPGDLVVEAHGSFASQSCIECKAPFPGEEMAPFIEKGEPPRCKADGCGGLVKPDIVFFGEQLPSAFFDNRHVPEEGDLVLILGTSLTVHPFASLPDMAFEQTPRVLFNKERVGTLGHRADDVICLGDCDSGIRKLADELGWRDELERLWRGMVGDEEADRQLQQTHVEQEKDEEMERLVQGVADKLDISGPPVDEDQTANDDRQAGLTEEAPTVAGTEAEAGTESAEAVRKENSQAEAAHPESGAGGVPTKDPLGDRGDAAAVAGAASSAGGSPSTPQEVKPEVEDAVKSTLSEDTKSELPTKPVASHVMKT